MNEEEIDSWYEGEKEKIFENYTQLLEENKGRDIAEKKFNKEMGDLRKEYEEKYDVLDKKKRLKKKMKPVRDISKKMGNLFKQMKEVYK